MRAPPKERAVWGGRLFAAGSFDGLSYIRTRGRLQMWTRVLALALVAQAHATDSVPPTQSPAIDYWGGVCTDLDGEARDQHGDSCATWSERMNTAADCAALGLNVDGSYPDSTVDDADFTRNSMCCACGGGNYTNLVAAPTFPPSLPSKTRECPSGTTCPFEDGPCYQHCSQEWTECDDACGSHLRQEFYGSNLRDPTDSELEELMLNATGYYDACRCCRTFFTSEGCPTETCVFIDDLCVTAHTFSPTASPTASPSAFPTPSPTYIAPCLPDTACPHDRHMTGYCRQQCTSAGCKCCSAFGVGDCPPACAVRAVSVGADALLAHQCVSARLACPWDAAAECAYSNASNTTSAALAAAGYLGTHPARLCGQVVYAPVVDDHRIAPVSGPLTVNCATVDRNLSCVLGRGDQMSPYLGTVGDPQRCLRFFERHRCDSWTFINNTTTCYCST